MTIEQRLEQVEQQNQKIQRTNKRLTVALTMMAVAMCAVVTMAARDLKDGYFDTVQTRKIWVTNDAGDTVVSIGASDYGDGLVYTYSANGKELVRLSAAESDYGMVTTYQPNGKKSVGLSGTENGARS
jgi:outer membrane protein assembly factor BamB